MIDGMKFTCVRHDELKEHPLYKAYIESHAGDFVVSLVGDNFIFLHEDSKIISGMGIISSTYPYPHFFIESIGTEKNYQEKDYASKLLEYFLRKIRNKKRNVRAMCAKENKEGRGLFEKFGFKPIIGDEDHHPDELELKFKDFSRFTEN